MGPAGRAWPFGLVITFSARTPGPLRFPGPRPAVRNGTFPDGRRAAGPGQPVPETSPGTAYRSPVATGIRLRCSLRRRACLPWPRGPVAWPVTACSSASAA